MAIQLPSTQTGKNKQSSFILAAIVLAGLIGGYFYYSQVLKTITSPQIPKIPASDTLAQFKDVKFDFSIFNDARFKVLKIFGESPVQPGTAGKTDLFAPF